MKTVIITHANCNDGFTAAWIARNYWINEQNLGADELEFIECHYQSPEIDRLDERIAGNRVQMFDFSFPRETMIRYEKIAQSFMVWDHHESARLDCAGLPCATFDTQKSGAVLAWEYFYPGVALPRLVEYVQDRDLWTWKLLQSRAVNAYLMSWQRKMEVWDSLDRVLRDNLAEAIVAGQTILRITEGAVNKACYFAGTAKIGGVRVPFVNQTNLISETLEVMAKGKPFAASFFMETNGAFVFSLRSEEQGEDVSKIAKLYDGGGHVHAAGFRVPFFEFKKIWETVEGK